MIVLACKVIFFCSTSFCKHMPFPSHEVCPYRLFHLSRHLRIHSSHQVVKETNLNFAVKDESPNSIQLCYLAKVSWYSMRKVCVKLFAISLALHLMVELSDFYLTVNTHLHLTRTLSLGRSTRSQVPFFSRAWISFSIVAFHSVSCSASCILIGISTLESLVTKKWSDGVRNL